MHNYLIEVTMVKFANVQGQLTLLSESGQRRTSLTRARVVQTFVVSVQWSLHATLGGVVLVHVLAVAVIAAESMHLSKDTAHHQKQNQEQLEKTHFSGWL